MRRLSIVGLAGIFLLFFASQVQALGKSFTLGYDCQYYFTPPTNHVDPVTGAPTGSPITGALTYSVYLVQSLTQPTVMPLTPTIANVSGVTAVGDPNAAPGQTWKIRLCNNTNTTTGAVAVSSVGQWWMTVTATEAGDGTSAQASPLLPFVLVAVPVGAPAPPTNGDVK